MSSSSFLTMKSITVLPESTSPTRRVTPAQNSICSVVVVLPASTCAAMPMFLTLEENAARVTGRAATARRKRSIKSISAALPYAGHHKRRTLLTH